MQELIAYMITWTTYGTWLQGDARGWVREGETFETNPALEKSNLSALKQKIITLNHQQRIAVQNAIVEEAKRINHKIYAISVRRNHVHIVAENYQIPMNQMVKRYKNVATAVLKRTGLNQKIWTKGFDKRFCFTEKELINRIEYVKKHDE